VRVALPKTYHQLAVLRGTAWVAGGRERADEPRSGFEPPGDRAQRGGDLRHHTGPARVGSCPPRTQSCPSRISCSYSNSPRGGARTRASRPRSRRRRGRAHEQPRLLEPSNGAAQMRAVHREHLELLVADTAHPARDLRGRPVPRDAKRVVVRRQARLPSGKRVHLTELDPCLAGTPADRPEEVADDRYSRQHGGEGAQ
jgi:hypothetical protein